MKVIVKEPGKAAEFREVENTLEALQKIVGGYIETVTLFSDLVIICNEEGRILNLPYNCNICGVEFVGTIIFAGIDGEDFGDVPIQADDFGKLLPEVTGDEEEGE